MKFYIRATGNISAQDTFGKDALPDVLIEQHTNRLNAVEPDYKDIIDPKMIRRMSRVIRMGVAAANDCLREAGITEPGAIITGTAYGCLQDTDLFLTKMVEQNEELLTPTAFIQSTHNTIGAQIGLMLRSHHYNNVFVHRGFSFESALLDGLMLLEEQAAENVLVGGIDEITDTSHALLTRFGIYKPGNPSNLNLFKDPSKGTIAGEGAIFFLIDKQPSGNDYAQLEAMDTFYKPSGYEASAKQLSEFLERQAMTLQDVDLVIIGRNGDATNDAVYDHLEKGMFRGVATMPYKDLCGEYPTSTAFALWLAASILKAGKIPASLQDRCPASDKIKRVLIYNHYLNNNHVAMLLSNVNV